MTATEVPICERCWSEIRPGERFAKLGQIRRATLRGDIEWSYTYLHPYADNACAPTSEETP